MRYVDREEHTGNCIGLISRELVGSTRNRPHHQERFVTGGDCFREWRVRRVMRQIFGTGEEPNEWPAELSSVVPYCAPQIREASLEGVQDGALGDRAFHLQPDFALYTGERPQLRRKYDTDHDDSVWTSIESTAGRSRTIAFQ